MIFRLAALALADFRERTRRFSFLLTLGFALYAAYLFLPPNHHIYATLQLANYRGVYNSPWVGTLVAMMTTVFLGLAGFYVVKNTVTRDRRTRVGEILAATSMSNRQYLMAKFDSNLAVLLTMTAVLIAAAGIMQFVRGESSQLEPLKLVLPFVFITLPVMALVAALAVFFESVRWLRGGLGNVVYYFVWTAMIMTGALATGKPGGISDPGGLRLSIPSMQAGCHAAYPDYDPAQKEFSVGFHLRADGQPWHLDTFEWDGIHWNMRHVADRAMWIALSILLVLVSAVPFDRFRAGELKTRERARAPSAESSAIETVPAEGAYAGGISTLSDEVRGRVRGAFARLVAAELRLMLNGVSIWWYLVALGLVVACAVAPMRVARTMLFPLAWIWPILLWSPLGSRELRYGTDPLLYSSPRPLLRQLPATWTAGVLLALVTGAGMLIRFGVTGNTGALGAWAVGVLFVPTLALCFGVVTGSSKLFEIVYLILWYAGPLNGMPLLDYMGATAEGVSAGMPQRFLMITGGLAVVAVLARLWRLRH